MIQGTKGKIKLQPRLLFQFVTKKDGHCVNIWQSPNLVCKVRGFFAAQSCCCLTFRVVAVAAYN